MAVNIGPRIGIEGEENYRAQLMKIIETQKLLNDEMKKAQSSWDDTTSAEKKAADQKRILTEQVNKQKERVAQLRVGLKQSERVFGENSTQTMKWKQALYEAETELNRLQHQLDNVPTKVQLFGQKLEETGRKMQDIGQKIKSAGQAVTNIGQTLTRSVTAPVLAAGTAAVKLASDYEENLNKVDASFKDNAGVVKVWAKTATKNFGMSESAALDATSTFGDMGTSMGLSTKDAAAMSTSLAGLAGDLSSFKNIDIKTAMTALKGVFTGETESLKGLGVVMTETNLKAFAEDMGLVYDEMTQAQKVTLRYQYVMKNTANAQGDYLRTSDGFANSLRTLKAEASNLGAAFGQELLPYITPLVKKATDLVRSFSNLSEAEKETIIKTAGLAAAIGPALLVVGKLTSGVGSAVETGGKFVEWLGKATSGHIQLAGAIAPVGAILAATVATAALMEAGFRKIREESRNLNTELYNTIDATKSATSGMQTAGEELTKAFDDAQDSIDNTIAASNRAEDIADDLAKLASKSKLTVEEQRKMKALVSELNSIYPELNLQIDENTGKLNKSTQEIQNFVSEASKMAKIAAYQEAINTVTQELSEAYIAQAKAQMEAERASAELAASQSDLTGRMQELLSNTENLTAAEKFELGQLMAGTNAYTAEGQAVHSANKALVDYNRENEKLTQQTDEANSAVEFFQQKIDELTGGLDENAEALEGTTAGADDAEAAYDELGEQVEETTSLFAESVKEIEDFYESSYQSAKDSLMGQTGLWEELEAAESTTVASMQKGLQSHIQAYKNFGSNVNKLTSSTAYQTDANFRLMVNTLIAAGTDSAPQLEALVNEYESADGDISGITKDFGELIEWQDYMASTTAQAETNVKKNLYATETDFRNSGVPAAAKKMMGDTGDAIKNYDLGEPTKMAVRKVGDAKPEMQTQTKAVMQEFINTVKGQQPGMESTAGAAGSGSATSMAQGMWNKAGNVYNAAVNLAKQASGPVSGLDGTTWGEHLASSLAQGMWNKAQAVWNAAKNLADTVARFVHFTHPDEGPLKEGTEIWGRHLAQDYAAGIMKGVPAVSAAATDLAMAAALPTRTMMNIDAVSGANAIETLTVDDIYSAFSAAMSENETKIVIGNREFGRILRDQGVA